MTREIDLIARPADAVISAWVRSRRDIGDKDRGAILDLTQRLMRHHARLGWWLDRAGAEDNVRSRLLAWLRLDGYAPDRISGLFNGGDDAPLRLDESERVLLGKLDGANIVHADMPDETRVECPDWAADALRRRFGDDFLMEMTAMLTEPPLDLRANTLKTDRDTMLRAVHDLGFKAKAALLSPLGIRVDERLSLDRLPMLRAGEVEIQDEGSQLVAMLVDARPGDRVVDFCAGAGGKTLALAAQMKNKGHIVACDVNEGRLKRAVERFRKAGVHNAETRLLSSESDKWVKRHKLGFDRVLIDAPCSGTGTWRRNPDARWRPEEEQGLEALIVLQGKILTSAARLVKPGGRLVYATCSLLPEENEDQIARFLAAHPDYSVVPLSEAAPQITNSAHPDHLSLTPARHGTDGFFAAVLQRKAAVEGI
ncbi:MAG: RsmB/NOP family class I SAM-dependent RNA methyltransferase [Candidatus Devosia phytovorans]|uniref:RsmB/NOP family class I SAM-dependent RNA methyltransferase n=1 Tax=Candidatus Devosia phytovorans TaxID=3121372 RepID=A0AAJ5VWA9_9HYPH|nr:RsmB/NOP family class I SAM-dependent RNA methyltransferase [Devosia sp.]WEK04667.1 MAG: RsmB/NOP family class I SAM-dependent RNA methyltransferase [Devosia sp.]